MRVTYFKRPLKVLSPCNITMFTSILPSLLKLLFLQSIARNILNFCTHELTFFDVRGSPSLVNIMYCKEGSYLPKCPLNVVVFNYPMINIIKHGIYIRRDHKILTITLSFTVYFQHYSLAANDLQVYVMAVHHFLPTLPRAHYDFQPFVVPPKAHYNHQWLAQQDFLKLASLKTTSHPCTTFLN